MRRRRAKIEAGHEAMTLRSAVEVASVKAQVQGIVRRLRSTLDELAEVVEQLPDNGEVEDGDGSDAAE